MYEPCPVKVSQSRSNFFNKQVYTKLETSQYAFMCKQYVQYQIVYREKKHREVHLNTRLLIVTLA